METFKCRFTDEIERRKYLDFVGYCVQQAETCFNRDEVIKQFKEKAYCNSKVTCYHCSKSKCEMAIDESDAVEIVMKGGVLNE